MKKLFLASLFYGALSNAFAGVHFGSDAIIAGWYPYELDIRTHNYFLITSRTAKIGLGPVVNWERMHAYMGDLTFGGGIRVGENFFVELDAGYVTRTYEGGKIKGYMAALILGKHFGRFFRVSIPIHVKRFVRGTGTTFHTVDFYPYIGLGLGL